MIVFGNRVLCLVVLFLLQSAGWMGMVQGEPLISVGIKKHEVYNTRTFKAVSVPYTNSKSHCESNGGYLASGYTKVLRTEIVERANKLHYGRIFLIFYGADMEDSVDKVPDLSKRCVYSVPSLNCIIKWNQGLWANALGDGTGVGFYKGNDPSIKGAGPINGYDATIFPLKDSIGRLYVVHRGLLSNDLAFVLGSFNSNMILSRVLVVTVCEVQDGLITTTTEAPTTTTEAPTTTTEAPTTNKSRGARSEVSGAPGGSAIHSSRSNGLTAVAVVLPILLAILAIVLCLYFCGCICRRKADIHRFTEDSRATAHTNRKGSVMHRKAENLNMDTTSGKGMNPLLGEDRQRRREIRNTWIENPQQANVPVQESDAVPGDSDAVAEQQSRRRSFILRTRLDRWRSMKRSGVVVPIGEVIADDTIGE